jgi:hypothetical protein
MARKLTKADVKKAAAMYGAEVEETGYISKPKLYQFHVNAPEGYQWADAGCLGFVVLWDGRLPNEKQEAFQDVINRINQGLEEIDTTVNP